MNDVNSCFAIFPSIFLLTTFTWAYSAKTNPQLRITKPVRNISVENKFVPYRYDRSLFFFFSENVTETIFMHSILKKLNELDDYCGGENVRVINHYGASISGRYTSYFNTLNETFINAEDHFTNTVTQNVFAGEIDHEDIGNLSETLLKQIKWSEFHNNNKVYGTKQVILVTDYVTDSLVSEDTTKALHELKITLNITFIALVTNISDAVLKNHSLETVWDVYPNYTSWESDLENPICGYKTSLNTTPKPAFGGDAALYIYLYLSKNYIRQTQMKEIIEFLSHLTIRRWWKPCRQYRTIGFFINIPQPFCPSDGENENYCYLEDAGVYSEDSDPRCSEDIFRSWIGGDAKQYPSENFKPGQHKVLLITDVPLLCDNVGNVAQALENVTDYPNGAPFTVIAIDKANDKSVARSYEQIFPSTQRHNLYEVNDLHELIQNINKTVNFCLDVALLIDREEIQNHQVVWYFYLIGAVILASFIAILTYLVMRYRKRDQKLKRILTLQCDPSIETEINLNEYALQPIGKDPWEIAIQSLDIDYKRTIGKGAFSIVHSGFLRGRAPVLALFPSIALQKFENCEVAVKTLPHHYNESAKNAFRNEIQLMKDIGFHIHLVGMLGCNFSIERPILVMELASQSLLNWLATCDSVTMDTEKEISLSKTLLALSWQVSNGMSYLSSKCFVHRDIAARNVLLNKELKAMVSDFGLCQKLISDDQIVTIPGGKVPLKWMALESLQDHQFSLKTDVWSFGVLLFEIFSLGKEPYQRIAGEEILPFLREGHRLEQPRLARDEMYELMKQCWLVDPIERPDFTNLKTLLECMLEDSDESYGYLKSTEYDRI